MRAHLSRLISTEQTHRAVLSVDRNYQTGSDSFSRNPLCFTFYSTPLEDGVLLYGRLPYGPVLWTALVDGSGGRLYGALVGSCAVHSGQRMEDRSRYSRKPLIFLEIITVIGWISFHENLNPFQIMNLL